MKLRQLEVFFVLAEELHFGRTAKRLHVAQPAVSQTIGALEEELGTQLFDRSKRRTQLTAAGVVFLEESQKAIQGLQRAKMVARQAGAGERGSLCIGLTAVSTLSVLPKAITMFQQAHPNVRLHVEQMGTIEQCKALALGEIDVGFTVLVGEIGRLSHEPLTQEDLMAILPEEHPLTKANTVSFEALLNEPMILMSKRREPGMHKAYHRLCEQYGCTPRVVLELDHLESMFAFVAAGMGASLAPAAALRIPFPGIAGRPLSPAYPAGISFLWDDSHHNPVTSRFLGLVRSLGDCKKKSNTGKRDARGGCS